MSQHQLARALGLSVGKTHCAIRAEHKALMTEIEQLRAKLQGTEPADEPPTP